MDVQEIVSRMSLDEKLRLIAGKDYWHMEGVESAGLPPVMLTDGPHGLRKQAEAADHLGINKSVPSTCFPPACLMASSWDESVAESVGEAIAEECIGEGVSIVLGPGVNIKRSPLCGRNFEYYSEDPLLAGKMGAAFIRGAEKLGIGTSLKHFAANNQEKARMISNSVVDERALREIYLRPFEIAVKEAEPATVMCSYNMINGVYSAENRWLLTDVLRKEWGFGGFVMTDWGAMTDRVKAVKAGLDLEMPGPAPHNAEEVRKAIENGTLAMEELDECVSRLVSFILRAVKVQQRPYSIPLHHETARKAAASSLVLLENHSALPLSADGKYAVIGSLAEHIRYQGAGSSKINPHKVDNILSALDEAGVSYEYAPGYSSATGESSSELIEEALKAAEGKDAVILVLGLPDSYESEGFDRTHMNLPEGELEAASALIASGAKVIALVMAGAPVLLPFRKEVSALLFCYLGGEAAGSAVADVLTGRVNPSGKLAETFPVSENDIPCRECFATSERNVEYRESIFVGYRYYDWAGKEVAYPFGYGLSYTTFSLSGLAVSADSVHHTAEVSVRVRNTGKRSGSEVVQIYTGMTSSRIMRPLRELAAFRKIHLDAGEEQVITFSLGERCFSYYDTETGKFEVESGEYMIYAGVSSRDLLSGVPVVMEGTDSPSGAVTERGVFPDFEKLFSGPLPLIRDDGSINANTPLSQALESERGRRVLGPLVSALEQALEAQGDDSARMMLSMLYDMPLRAVWMFSPQAGDAVRALIE